MLTIYRAHLTKTSTDDRLISSSSCCSNSISCVGGSQTGKGGGIIIYTDNGLEERHFTVF